MMTDAHLMSHAFRLSHPLSSSAAWSLLNGADESTPSLVTPFPSSNHPPSTELTATFDPTLCITPERTVASQLPLQHPHLGVSGDDCESNRRTTKVHFDQTVSVHHLSPEYGSNNASSDDHCFSGLNCNADVLSSMCDQLDTSDVEPISIIASDLRRLSPNSVSLLKELESSKSLQQNSSASKNISGDCTRKKKKSKSDSSTCTQVVTEVGRTGSVPGDSAHTGQHVEPTVEAECVLARPEFNSMLKMSSKIAQLQQLEFDMVAVTKEKISPKLKQQVFEKVRCLSCTVSHMEVTSLLHFPSPFSIFMCSAPVFCHLFLLVLTL